MEAQNAISARLQARKVGRRVKAIVDAAGPTADRFPQSAATMALAKGRTVWDAPDIDGAIHIASRRPLRPGDIVTVKIERAEAYDLHGIAV
jgi:ribosomal protein S12 methylthiotransferase